MSEEWRPVRDYPAYEVSNLGRVRSMKPKGGFGRRPESPRLMVLKVCTTGYREVGLRNQDGRRYMLVHSLVLEAFVGPRPHGMQCAHEDGNRENNVLENLSWKTPADNNRDKIRHGTLYIGEAHPMAKLSDEDVMRIRESRESSSDAADSYGVTPSMIRKVRSRKNWRHVA